jgi:hypothetical protein
MQRKTQDLVDVVRARLAVAASAGTTVAVALCMLLARLGRAGWPLAVPAAPSAEDVLAGLLVWAAAALCGWLALGSAATAAACLPGALGAASRRAADRLTPRLVRQGLAVLLGTAVGTVSLPVGAALGAAPTARTAQGSASEKTGSSPAPEPGFRAAGSVRSPGFAPTSMPTATAVPVSTSGPSAAVSAPDPGWRPSPPVRVVDPGESRLLAPPPRAAEERDTTVTVRRGDSLWSIVARHLGPEASDLEVARAWPAWYAANRAVIGADPDLLVPGQLLRPPAGAPR